MSEEGNGWRPMQQEQETRRVKTDALWEDVLRPVAQSVIYALSTMWQIITVLAALVSWSVAWSESRHSDPMLGDVPLLISAATWFVSLFVIGVIVSANRSQWLIGRIAGYDESRFDNVWIAVMVITCWILCNVLFNQTVVYVLLRARVIPVAATVIAVASWFSMSHLREGLKHEIIANSPHNSDKYHITLANNEHALRMRMLERQFQLEDRGDDDEVEDRAIEVSQADAIRFVPVNHGSARSVGIGQQTFKPDELALMSRFISEWTSRGTARAQWTTDNGHGWRLSDPQWDKFTAALRSVGILDQRNHPTIGYEQAISDLHLPPYPAEIGRGDGENASESRPVPSRPELLEQAIRKLPKASENGNGSKA